MEQNLFTPNSTKSWVYSLVKCCITSTKTSARGLYKVAWCDIYKSAENKAGSKWVFNTHLDPANTVLDKGKGKRVRLSPIAVNKKNNSISLVR